MSPGPGSVRYLLAAVGIFYAAAFAITLHPFSPNAVYLYLVSAPLFAFAACLWRTLHTPRHSRTYWSMFSVGILIWALGMSFSAWEDITGSVSYNVAFFSDLFYLLYGVPILLVITYPSESEIVPSFLLLDAIQAAVTGCAVYFALFDVLPFGNLPLQPLPQPRIVLYYDIENFMLATLATVRLLAGSRNRGRLQLLRLLTCFLWVYALMGYTFNHTFLATNGNLNQLFELLPPLPFVFLAVTVCWPTAQRAVDTPPAERHVAVWIDNFSPVFYTLALIAIGLVQVRSHLYIGMAAILVATLIYALRMTMLQSRYLNAQNSLREAHDRLHAITLTDPLTGIPNRRCFDQTLDAEWRRSVRLQRPLSLLLIDVDFFKHLNDRYGHPAGDDCLVRIANALNEDLPRSGDLVARYGGEEFAAVLTATDADGAAFVAARMREAVHRLAISNPTDLGPTVSLSIGVATCQPVLGGSIASLIATADRALYEAKRHGRNGLRSITLDPLSLTESTTR